MNDEDLQVQFKVIGTFGAPGHTYTLGTYQCIRDARIMVDTWKDDPQYRYTMFDDLKIVKHSQVTVHSSKGLGVQENNLPDSSSLSPPAAADYERQGVVDTTPVEELRDLLHHLEDRHVGLRHELLNDMEVLQDDIEEIRDDAASAAADIDNLEEAMRHEVAGLRRELEVLRASMVSSERRSGGPRQQANRRHEEWERQQKRNKEATKK